MDPENTITIVTTTGTTAVEPNGILNLRDSTSVADPPAAPRGAAMVERRTPPTPGVQDLELQFRTVAWQRESIDENRRTIELSFSSEEPVLRWGEWYEILDHSKRAVRLKRLNSRGPVLLNHWGDQVGVVERAWIGDDRRGHAVVRFSRSQLGTEIWQDVVDEIRGNVSVGYWIHNLVLEESKDGEPPKYRAKDWEPIEISFVSIPADITVGAGRSAELPRQSCRVVTREEWERSHAVDEPEASAPVPVPQPAEAEPRRGVMKPGDQSAGGTAVAEDVAVVQERATTERNAEIAQMLRVAKNHDCVDLAMEYISSGKRADQFFAAVLEKKNVTGPLIDGVREDRTLGLTDKEAKQFSLLRLIDAMCNPSSRDVQDAAAYEMEVTGQYAKKIGAKPEGRMIPPDVLHFPMRHNARNAFGPLNDLGPRAQANARDVLAGTATFGPEVIPQVMMGLVEFLENRSILMQLCQVFRDVTGTLIFPREATSPNAGYTASEVGAVGELAPTFNQLSLTPKTAGGSIDLSVRHIKMAGNFDTEAWARRKLFTKVALAVDLHGFTGSGAAGQPLGLLNMVLGSVTMANPPTWANIVEYSTDVATANADVAGMNFVTSAMGRGKLESTPKDSSPTGKYLWENGRCGNYPGYVTNQLPVNLGAGVNETPLIFGNWQEFVMALWGGMDLIVDPYTKKNTNLIEVTGRQEADHNVLHAGAFSVGQFIR